MELWKLNSATGQLEPFRYPVIVGKTKGMLAAADDDRFPLSNSFSGTVTPATMASAVYWWRSRDMLPRASEGFAVASITDYFGAVASQAIAANRPVYCSSGGVPFLRFDPAGAPQWLRCSNLGFGSVNDMALFAVYRSNNRNGASCPITLLTAANGTAGAAMATNSINTQLYNTLTGGLAGADLGWQQQIPRGIVVSQLAFSSTGATLKINDRPGTAYTDAGDARWDDAPAAGVQFGTVPGYESAFASAIDLFEIVILKGYSAQDLLDAQSYLIRQYGAGQRPPLDRPLIILEGNSKMAGATTGSTYTEIASMLRKYLPRDVEIVCPAVSGYTWVDLQNSAAQRVYPLYDAHRPSTVIVNLESNNDLLATAGNATTSYSRYKAYFNAQRVAMPLANIITVTAEAFAGVDEGVREDYNSLLINDAALSTADKLAIRWNLGADADIGEAGTNLNATYYQNDHRHWTAAGHDKAAKGLAATILTVMQ